MNITVYLGANPGNEPEIIKQVEDIGTLIGLRKDTLIYGGSKAGLMGILADSVLSSGGSVIGIEPRCFIESELQHEGIDRLIVTETFQERKAKMIELADAFIALPGGTGTLDEISEIIEMTKLGSNTKPCIIYNFRGYYDGLISLLNNMESHGFLPDGFLKKLTFAESISDVKDAL